MILIDENTRAIVQGITGRQGSFHTKEMLDVGTKIVAGVTPGKGGKEIHGIPVYDTVKEAVEEHDVNASVLFVPAPAVKDAVYEAIDGGIELIVIITEHVPVHDTVDIVNYGRKKGVKIIGPNTPGIASPKFGKLGIIPARVLKEGYIGMVSRSGTLTYEIANQLVVSGYGQSTCVGIGGDPVVGTDFIDILQLFEKDRDTDAVVMVGEIGGSSEERASEYIKKMEKPVVAYIAGISAPEGKRMGHAGAIIERGLGTVESKMRALRDAGAYVVRRISEIPTVLKEVL
ncbi:MAG TPA: succinate--CoA ligase subunit alpha [Methanothermococcus okinawensis]|uniref:Succinate--CoA ligase [ADP-forming] subunit alpha n=1 Tax=Methanofervidicoccus abyssi TaxID=2082189 RepID=A0A401HQD4_9EURY|nr:succinate--CoA ligase subunit alpha [Methanofervidicoccus abyssi]GBF36476.1 succinyl-CoA synthetase alpha subunit [Methanofervidicoccus abyssi]HIP15986.1 succinate--CoA ligase subunit alpha [Methanothermococcus okinawensis]HIP35128.1 succinate--CoA ligase subunit alpha [Methanothermococcus okinawensis]